MPWGVWIWIAVLLLAVMDGVFDDFKKKVPIQIVLLDSLGYAITLTGILAYYKSDASGALGALLFAGVLAAAAWEITRTIPQILEQSVAPDKSPTLIWGSTLAWGFLIVPAWILGIIAGVRSL
jgi:hypothetical protein